MKKYDSYIKSPIPWFSNIPEHWEIGRLKHLLYERKENNNPIKTTEILSLTNKRGVIPYSQKGNVGNKSKDRIEDYHLAYPNDLVVNNMNVIIGSSGVSQYYGAISPVYYALVSRGEVNIGYCGYIFRLQTFFESLKGLGNGILEHRKRIPITKLNNVLLPVPPRAEQDQIVHFLDWKVSGINRLIENKRKKLNSLKELKKDIVDCTVKSGIRDDVPVRDSGVYWIGKIPSHWSVMRLKSQIKLSNEKTSDNNLPYIGMENIESWTGKYVKKNEVKPESTSNVYKAGNILFGKLRPYLAKVFITEDDGICSSEFLVFKSFQLERKYLFYYLISSSFIDVVNSSTYGAKMPRANWDFIGNCPITIPPKEEQKEIVKYLDSVFIKIDSLIRNTEQIVERLRELKTRLISDVVTGQIDVRNIEIPEYEYVDEEPEGDSDDVNGDFDSEEISEEA
jgi:type I restriction enzyme S subunit